MSKSLKRVQTALDAADIETKIVKTEQSRTAQEAADAVGCELNQIVKSIVLQGEGSGGLTLFLTAGGHQVSMVKASALAGEPMQRADSKLVRSVTGFAIGGVAPVGHLQPIACFIDPDLLNFDTVWAAAGTPQHVFAIDPASLRQISDAQSADFT
ncbi:MAG: YbaK/EbsC family protein [Paracoccaceae bacterium]